MTRRARAIPSLVALPLAVALAACSSPRIAGGYVANPSAAPTGVTVGDYAIRRCVDAGGQGVPESDATVSLVRRIDGRVVLLEEHPGLDTMVVENAWTEGGTRVFQLVVKRASGDPLLREYRLPHDPRGEGRLAVVRDVAWEREAGPTEGFVGRYARAELTCALAPGAGGAAPGGG